ncbi:unnamed protein product [Triticum turgidum subsp. durum]|uniref:Uncharacterized protein n=1 Tax=Triticum turgidum subsp. durum TaxID=4567 RepID=A0A9R1QXK4_TRITD|nr:unnamed protein product [Triticum turgidum subsp. durum]
MAAVMVREVLYMYSVVRQAYERLLSMCGSPEKAQNAVALLVWLDQDTISAIHFVPAIGPDVVAVVAEEANAILKCFRHQLPMLPPIPLISALCMQGGVCIDPGFFAFHQDLVVRSVPHFLDGAGKKWGDFVVRVLMEKTKGGLMPMYGRIIFKTEAIVKLVLNGERLVKISIGHRQIWLRKYVPRPTKATV